MLKANTPEQSMIIRTAEQVGEKYGLDYWRQCDQDKRFPAEFWKEVCEAGLCGVALPEEHGGAGFGMVEMALAIEALSMSGGGATVAQLFMLNPIFGGIAISKFGTEEMKSEWLPQLVSGDMQFCMALTEPDAGSNSLSISTIARRDGDGWRLSGNKVWITGVPAAHKMLVVARTTPADQVRRKTDGISLFLIDTDRDGLSHTAIDKLGTNTLASSSVYFDDVPVYPSDLVGTLDAGWSQLLEVLNCERIVTTAGLSGASRLATGLAVDYANERKVFGNRPIASYQGLQFPLAQAHALNECARLMNLRAAQLCDDNMPYGSEANAAKLIAAQAAAMATERSMQTMGGMGYSKEFHVERLWRDARLFRFAPISEEMVLNFIAQHDLGMARSY